ncbi:MAG: hypothetical protein COY66_00335 [Candidatus Kerfeldbacteria bacterium CG_4_10_14_0_8_um_filter_42_10]|uniref:Uncharacterized protein n=1 Tax=Candidatus Kerfeldbacteria bacterium CG_4_10_14_0_8_um_filter_42_10 TaxID=2014248 RepID=A0A2M7RLJ5_9BACT|nr:MAG: hypothetical protein COY66_00335 [Candidatus Kerfeldbacteria bacterium CG_4_10_14_0_8_um_filter_42_10]
MSVVKKITKNTFWLAISSITSKLIGFGIVVLVARNLLSEGFGQYSFALSFGIIINVIADFGLSTLTNRDLARDRNQTKHYIENIIVIKTVLTAVAFALLVIILEFIDKPLYVKVIVFLASLYVVIESYNTFFYAVFRANEKMQFETISRILERGLILGLIALFFNLGYGIFFVFVAYIVGELISMLVTAIIVYKKFCHFTFRIDLPQWKKFLKPSLFFALTNVFIIVYFKIDVLMLSIMKNDRITGLYSSAYDLLFAFIFIPTIMNAVVFPRISFLARNFFDKFKILIQLLLKYFLIIAFPLSIGLYFTAPFLMKLIYGSDFLEAIPLFQLMSIVMVFVFLNFINGSYLNALDKQHISTIIAGICMVLNIAINLVLIPILAAKGAAIATIITEAVLALFSLLAIKKFTGEPKAEFIILSAKLILASLIAIGTGILTSAFHPILQGITACLTYSLAVFALGVFNAQDRPYFLELVRK